MKRSSHLFLIGMVSLASMLHSCLSPKNPVDDETTTRGSISIGVDDSYRLIAEAELYTFQSLYQYAKIKPLFLTEDSVLQLFLKDSIRMMITSRKLNKNEEAYLESKQIVPRTTLFAFDAVAFIVNRNNPDTLLRYNSIRDIFQGKTSKWNQVKKKSKLGDISIVFDNARSANVRYMIEKFNLKAGLPKYCFSAVTNDEVVNYVEKHPNAIGIISVNWVSDPQDSVSHGFLKRVKVVAVSSEFYSEGNDFYFPHPAYIADKSYPFIREVYTIGRETFNGLGSGFIQFVTYEKGQRIVLRSGMVPATMPIRLMQIKKE
jgi:phosphate transport system substrate-binding protein